MTGHRTSALPCPKSCPWSPHPENAAFEKCGNYTCQIVRPKPTTKGSA